MPDPLWKVTGITDTVMYEPSQGPVPAKRVDFKLITGTPSFVTVPLSEFNKDSVANKIDIAAEHLINVLQLEGPIVPDMQDLNPGETTYT